MKNIWTMGIAMMALIVSSCTMGQTKQNNLSATTFEEKIKANPGAVILDVRSPEEYAGGHLAKALNYDWNGSGFDQQISGLDKSKPVFVYCLSGGRSTTAANKMRSDGFKEVYELNGGILKWRAAKLPVEGADSAEIGMTKPQFDSLLNTDKLVLVDFYAEWCAPCKKMKPYLEEIAKDMADKVLVLRIDVDANNSLCKELNVDALPVLQLYKNKSLSWTNTGFIEKAEVLKRLK